MHYSLDNTVAKSLLALGESKKAKQLIVSENSPGLVQIKGNLPTKRAVAVNLMMKSTNTKLGQDKFLFWWHTIETSFLIHTSNLVCSGGLENQILPYFDIENFKLAH